MEIIQKIITSEIQMQGTSSYFGKNIMQKNYQIFYNLYIIRQDSFITQL